MSISDSQIEDLRERSDLVALIGQRVQLRKAGKDHLGLCPLHGERTPSFYVIPHKRMWHCFGCGQNGDVFRFFMQLDGMSFVDAIRFVARESGVPLNEERESPEEIRRRKHVEELAALMERAVHFYEQKLWRGSGAPARQILQRRGITEETARAFRLGFAGAARDELSRALDKAGVNPEHAIEAGLCIAGRNGPFDRFHGRLSIPISIPRPPTGRPVALGGRLIDGLIPERGDRRNAKYINCPETPLYHKGRVLYALDRARDSIRREERAVVVEGYFDVIALHQAGLPLAVASCGTALTPEHLDLLTRTAAREIVFLFDGDAAGLRAAAKAAELCAKAQVPSRVATLPDGLDPDDFVRQRGLDSLKRLLDEARPAIDLLIDNELGKLGPSASVEERANAVDAVRSIVLCAPEGLSRELYIGQIAERLRVSETAVRAALLRPTAPVRSGSQRIPQTTSTSATSSSRPSNRSQARPQVISSDRPSERASHRPSNRPAPPPEHPAGAHGYPPEPAFPYEQEGGFDSGFDQDFDQDFDQGFGDGFGDGFGRRGPRQWRSKQPGGSRPGARSGSRSGARKEGNGRAGGWGGKNARGSSSYESASYESSAYSSEFGGDSSFDGRSSESSQVSDGPSPGVAARRTYSLEEAVAVALLKYPVLAATVAQEGILGEFSDPGLRELGERVIACMAEGVPVDAASLLATLPAAQSRAIRGKISEGEAPLDDYASHLGRVLDRLRIEQQRRQARATLLAQERGLLPDDAASQQAFAEEQQRQLEESRRIHLRIREREQGQK